MTKIFEPNTQYEYVSDIIGNPDEKTAAGAEWEATILNTYPDLLDNIEAHGINNQDIVLSATGEVIFTKC